MENQSRGPHPKAIEHKKQTPVKPIEVAAMVPWENLRACVILGVTRQGEVNKIYMSDITFEQLALVTMQLQAQVSHHLGPLVPTEEKS